MPTVAARLSSMLPMPTSRVARLAGSPSTLKRRRGFHIISATTIAALPTARQIRSGVEIIGILLTSLRLTIAQRLALVATAARVASATGIAAAGIRAAGVGAAAIGAAAAVVGAGRTVGRAEQAAEPSAAVVAIAAIGIAGRAGR